MILENFDVESKKEIIKIKDVVIDSRKRYIESVEDLIEKLDNLEESSLEKFIHKTLVEMGVLEANNPKMTQITSYFFRYKSYYIGYNIDSPVKSDLYLLLRNISCCADLILDSFLSIYFFLTPIF